ncbi:aminotransferase class IV [Janibacter sp. GXQ6167]|uniref:aminotransferase class IV n=1 Tax=Janibacter sp. GXQ6167 TaxID=3240791 RepID=UPI00352650B8
MNSEARVWVDGALVRPDEASVAALDHGVTVGDGAFETCKVVDGTPFALTRHLMRLDRTMAGLGLPTADHARIREGIEAVCEAGEPIPFGRLRFTITGGVGPMGSDRANAPLTYIVTTGPIPRPAATGVLVTVPWTRNERAATAGLKTTSYADNVVALAYVKERGGDEAIFANTRGELCEGTGSNLFVVRDGVVLTPPLDSGCLAGITRELTIEWARGAGIEVREEALPLGVLDEVDEVFATSTTKDVLGIRRVDDREFAAPGPVTARVAQAFADASARGIDP